MARLPGTQPIAVDKATAEDLDRIMEIEQVSFPTPWTRAALAEELDRPWSFFQVLRGPQGEVLAYLNYWVLFDEVHLLNIATHPGHRRRGHAKALLEPMIRLAEKNAVQQIHLEVRPSNLAARRLYESLGFTQVGTRPGYYADTNEDALLYRLLFKNAEVGELE